MQVRLQVQEVLFRKWCYADLVKANHPDGKKRSHLLPVLLPTRAICQTFPKRKSYDDYKHCNVSHSLPRLPLKVCVHSSHFHLARERHKLCNGRYELCVSVWHWYSATILPKQNKKTPPNIDNVHVQSIHDPNEPIIASIPQKKSKNKC